MRLFAAIPIQDALREQLEKLRVEIPEAWWVKPSLYHVTLQFIGADIGEERLPEIIRSLQRVQAQPFEISLVGLERFQTPDWSGVVWVKVAEHPALSQLHAAVVFALESIGLELEKNAFQPHMTLVYLGNHDSEKLVESYLAKHDPFVTQSVFVHDFILYETVETSDDTIFVQRAVFTLND